MTYLYKKSSVALAAAFVLLTIVYFALSMGAFRGPNWLANDSGGSYLLLSKAFLAGRTSIDEASTGQTTNWDLSAYGGKYYMYFGPVPALTLYLPAYLLSFKTLEVTDEEAVVLFSVGCLLIYALILDEIKRRFYPGTKTWLLIACLSILAVSNGSSALLSHIRIYEVAIAAGLFYLLVAVLFMVKTLLRDEIRPLHLSLISGSLVLAVGCRPTLFMLSVAVLSVLGLKLLRQKQVTWRVARSLSVPFSLGLAALAAYNLVRFGSPTEFGWHYQITVIDQSNLPVFAWDRLATGLYFNLFQYPHVIHKFPYLLVQNSGWQDLPAPYYLEYPLGLFPSAPFSLFALLLMPFFLLEKSLLSLWRSSAPVYFALLSLGIVSLLYLSAAPAVVDRYRIEYATFFILAGCVAWMHVNQMLLEKGKDRLRFVLSTVAVTLGGFGCYVNLFVATRF